MRKFLRKLLIKFLRVTVEETAAVAKEEVKKHWPAVAKEAELVIDGLTYSITSIDDQHVSGIRYQNSRKQVIKVNLEDIIYDSHAAVWRLPGR